MTALRANSSLADATPIRPAATGVEPFSTRALDTFDAPAFRALRLEAATGADAPCFAANDEASWPIERWRARIAPTPLQRFFGSFDDGDLFAIMGAWKHPARERTALWGNTFERKAYRGQHHARPIYEARAVWTRDNPHYDHAVFFIREDNERSRAIHEKQGARLIGKELMSWCAGPPAMACWYEMPLAGLRL